MKTTTKLFLIIFITFLSIQTIVRLLEKNSDISIIDDFSDEDQSIKVLKIEFNFVETFDLQKNNIKKTTSKIFSKFKFRYEMTFSKIFIPPPKLA
jgi:uncharacterized radical SAM superfamily protein